MFIDGRRQVAQGSNFAIQELSGGTGRIDGLVRGLFRQCYNSGGTTIPYGAPVVLETTYSGVAPIVSVSLPLSSSDQAYGVVVEPGGLKGGTTGAVMIQGTHPALRVQGSVTNHDALYLATTSGYATATRPNAQAVGLGKALVSLSTSSNGTIPADIQAFTVGLNSIPHRSLQGINSIRGHTNLLLTATSFVDSNGDDASEVNDGDTTTGEADFNIANYIQADMGAEVTAGAFEVLVHSNGAATIVITASHNASVWTELYRQPITLPNNPVTVRGGFKPSTFRYWRISTSIAGPAFYEWALYEPSGLDFSAYRIGSVDMSYQSNANIDDTLRRLDHHVDAITSSPSNTFVGTFELRAGTGVAFSALSNTVTISASGGAGASVSYGSNSNSVGKTNAAGAATEVSRVDHVHQGVHQITSNTSNALYEDINLQAGTGIALGVVGQTINISSTVTSGGGSSGVTLSAAALVQTAVDSDNATTTTPVLGATPTVGNILIAAVVSTGDVITSLAQTNVTWSELASVHNGTTLKVALWKGVIAAAAGTTLTVTGTAFLGCRLWEFSNLNGTLVQSSTIGDGTATSGAVTPHIVPSAGNMIFAVAGWDTGGTLLRPFNAKDGNTSNFVGAGYAYANPYGHSVGWVPGPNSVWASIIAEVS